MHFTLLKWVQIIHLLSKNGANHSDLLNQNLPDQ